MSIIAAILAVIFFANPYISTLDLLPDAIGCLLLWFALRRAEVFSPKLEEASRRWLRLAIVSGLDFIVSYVTPVSDATMVLLVVFVFRLAEAYLMFNAATETFDGLIYLGTKFEAEGIYMRESESKEEKRLKKENARREKLDRILDRERERYECETADGIDEEHRHRATMRYRRAVAAISADAGKVKMHRDGVSALNRATLVFVIIRAAACVLPEFTAISSYKYLGDVVTGGGLDLFRFRGMFRSIGLLIAAAVGIYWLVRMLRYIGEIRRDRRFRLAVSEEYERFISLHAKKVLSRRLVTALTFLMIGVILTIDIVIDNINYVPDFVSALFFIVFFVIILREGKNAKLGVIVSAVWGIASAGQWLAVYGYVDKFGDFTRTVKSGDAFNYHVICCVVTALTEALFIFLAILAFGELKRVIAAHTGNLSEDGEREARESVYIRQELTKTNSRAMVLSFIASAAALTYMIIVGINKQIKVENEVMEYVRYVPVFPAINIVTVGVTLIFIAYTVKYISDLNDAIKDRYRYL